MVLPEGLSVSRPGFDVVVRRPLAVAGPWGRLGRRWRAWRARRDRASGSFGDVAACVCGRVAVTALVWVVLVSGSLSTGGFVCLEM